jgi:hypothetical protein
MQKTSQPLDNEGRISQIADLLAFGLQRLYDRQSSELSAGSGESSLHFTLDQSGHAAPKQAENA